MDDLIAIMADPHSECKIMEDLFSGNPSPGGSLTMRINWNNGGSLSHMPCGQCMGSICKTAQQCGVEIYLCKEDSSNMLKKQAPCKTVKHKDGSESHKWDSSRW